jgi:hypothetical protein
MRSLLLLLVLLAPAAVAAPPKLTIAVAKQDPPKELSDPVRKILGTDAATVTDDAGTLSLTLWFRTEIPSAASDDQVKNGLTYREIAEGTLVGAVKLDKPFVDFRKQEIPAGVYTLRLAVQPENGDHHDTAPHQDFALLSPAGADKSVEPVEPKDLVKLSRKVLDSDHPAVMLLFPHHGPEEKPELVTQKDDIRCVRLRRPVTAGEKKASLGVSVVVQGVSKMR